jgi:hypothetical protein
MNLNQLQLLRVGSDELLPCGLFPQVRRNPVTVEDVADGLSGVFACWLSAEESPVVDYRFVLPPFPVFKSFSLFLFAA